MGIIETFRLRKFIKDNEKMITRCNRIAEQIERDGEKWFDNDATKNCTPGVSIENFKRVYKEGQQQAQNDYYDKASLFYSYAAEGCEFLCMICGNVNTKFSNGYKEKFQKKYDEYRKLQERDKDYYTWFYDKNKTNETKQQTQPKSAASKSEAKVK